MVTYRGCCMDHNRCNRCGRYAYCTKDNTWPAGDGIYYGRLCMDCHLRINDPAEWERQRMELVSKHSE